MKTLFRSLWHVNSVQMESNSSGVESTTHPTGNALLVQTRDGEISQVSPLIPQFSAMSYTCDKSTARRGGLLSVNIAAKSLLAALAKSSLP